jgi:metal-responsive CopG/Arc/MetJ family transcriptional regulator
MSTLQIQKDTTRTHIVIPTALVNEVDRLVGERKRSQFFADAAAEKVARLRLLKASSKAAGSLRNVAIPDWDTPEKTSEWVAKSRAESDERLARQP